MAQRADEVEIAGIQNDHHDLTEEGAVFANSRLKRLSQATERNASNADLSYRPSLSRLLFCGFVQHFGAFWRTDPRNEELYVADSSKVSRFLIVDVAHLQLGN